MLYGVRVTVVYRNGNVQQQFVAFRMCESRGLIHDQHGGTSR